MAVRDLILPLETLTAKPYQLRMNCRMTDEEIPRVLGIAPRTWRHYKQTGQIPRWMRHFLYVLDGHLPDNAWIGWRISQGRLWDPDGYWYEPDELRALPQLKALIRELRRELRASNLDDRRFDLENVIAFPSRNRS